MPPEVKTEVEAQQDQTTPDQAQEEQPSSDAVPDQEDDVEEDFSFLTEDDFGSDEDDDAGEPKPEQPDADDSDEGDGEPKAAEGETPQESEVEEPEKPEEQETKSEEKPDEPEQPQKKADEPEQPSPEPVDLNAQFEAWFKSGEELLSQQVYKLSPEEAEQIDSEPSKYVPQLAARLHMQVLTAVTTRVAQMLPQIMEHYSADKQVEEQSEREFYEKFSHLNKDEYKPTVNKMAVAYLNANPGAQREEAMQAIAAMSTVALQLPVGQTPQQQQEEQVFTPPPPPAGAAGAGVSKPVGSTEGIWSEFVNDED